MIQLLYIGNNLKQDSSNPSVMSTLGPLLEETGFRVHYASSKAHKLLRLADMLLAVIRHYKSTDYVLIDTYSTQNFYYAFLVSQLCRLLKTSYIPILHGGNLPSRLKNSPKMSSMIFNYAKMNIAPSQFLKSKFEKCGYRNLKYIPNTILIKNYPFKTKREFTTPKLLWVRSFSQIYNPTLAVEVLKVLLDRGYEAELCMVGPDSDGSLQVVKALAKDLEVSIKFTGKLKKAEWISLSKDYTFFINTTNFDNMPVSVLEAMAVGLPVVSTNVGGMAFMIENTFNGVLVPANDTNSFSDAIIKLMHAPETCQLMVSNARTNVEQFDWEVVKEKWIEILH